jgi:cytochrome c
VTLAGLTGDATAGQRIFGQCRTCHVVEPGVNRVGPSLHSIVGRTAGTVPGFNYSDANKNSGVTWTEEVLFEYLEDPRGFMPGTKMAFVGLKKPQDRADVIAYLKTQS